MSVKSFQQDTGSTIYQVTDDELPKSNIYCEVPYCSSDSRYFVFSQTTTKYGKNVSEYVVCELGTWKTHVVGHGIEGIAGVAITHKGIFYYLRYGDGKLVELVKLELSSGKSEVVHVFETKPRIRSLGTVSPDGKFYAYGVTLDSKFTSFGIEVVDLTTGTRNVIDSDPYILNPHPQFEPSEGRSILVQHNRGGQIDENGRLIRLVGEEGATLYILDVNTRSRIELMVGKPYTTPATGHETWIGNTKEVLLTVIASDEFAPENGNLLAVSAGKPARVISKGFWFNHVGTSVDGRFFSCDDIRTKDVVIGSVKTGKTAVICHSESSYGREQNTHPHPYLTPDLKWVVFNSDRSGQPQIHVASIPEGTIENLERE